MPLMVVEWRDLLVLGIGSPELGRELGKLRAMTGYIIVLPRSDYIYLSNATPIDHLINDESVLATTAIVRIVYAQ